MANSLILNIPHASAYIPQNALDEKHREDYTQKWKRELPFLIDWFTDEIFNNGIGIPIVAPISRVICDTERFEDDNLEPMAKKGMGVCYNTGHTGKEMFIYSKNHKKFILNNYYRIHHKNLEYAVNRVLDEENTPVIIDCHSFSSVPLLYEPDQNPDRPDICIGTDNYHTPNHLTEIAKHFFESNGFKVKVNSPYSGTVVPIKYYKTDSRVQSVMIEINRKLYMDENSIQKNKNFSKIKKTIALFEKEILEKITI